MARYDYRCTSCKLTFEVEHTMGEHPDVSCPSCGAAAEHVFDASAITFQGSGFYNTDRAGSSTTPATSSCESCPHKQSA